MAAGTGRDARCDEGLAKFHWQPQPEAAALVADALAEFSERCPAAGQLAARLLAETGTRLADWVDHVALPNGEPLRRRLAEAGFQPCGSAGQWDGTVWEHAGGLFPAIVAHEEEVHRVAIRVESVADFLAAHRLDERTPIEGDPLADLRRARIRRQPDAELWVAERHGRPGWEPRPMSPHRAEAVLRHAERFRLRRRVFADEEEGFDHALRLVRAAVEDLGPGRASDLFFAAEREYWTGRNRAARVEKARQDALGLGWANHDHHTYRSSREHFTRLVELLEALGLECRERFYAGREAGWGAQVLEQPDSSVVVFADVDLAADEAAGDFAHRGLAPRERFGTVGTWCKLHGEALLAAGMHHLECRFQFDAACRQLDEAGVRTMRPFTDLPYLKQAFTEGEVWPVEAERIEAALAAGAIGPDDAGRFRQSGAIGSHLEVLQRDQGYKGFNQAGINQIILQTDPRRGAEVL